MTDLRASFDSAADTYETARPSYPAALFDALIELCGLEPPASLLEIGCATGNATRPLAERGYSDRLRRARTAACSAGSREPGGPPGRGSRRPRSRNGFPGPSDTSSCSRPTPGTGSTLPAAMGRHTSCCGRAGTSRSGTRPRLPARLRPFLHRDPGRVRLDRRALERRVAAACAGADPRSGS